MTTEDRLKAIMYDHLNGRVTLMQALATAHAMGYSDGRDGIAE